MDCFNLEELVALRRALHQIPEIGLEEFETHRYLMAILEGFPQERMEIRTWQTAILVKVAGKNPRKKIGWRTDIDGLPITEATGLDFSSQHPGKMHACGHDFHMTIALGLLQRMLLTQPENDFIFFFQPAEENEAGGKIVYDAGVFGDWLPDEFYGLHVQPALPVGTISTRVGTLFAGTCEVKAEFYGKGGHAAFPHLANDMIVAASEFIQQAQTIVSRNVNPTEGAVVTFGTFHAGTTNNVIADKAELWGTIRTLTQSMSQLTQQRMLDIKAGIEKSFQCEIALDLDQKGYYPVENNPALTKKFINFMEELPAVDFVEATAAMTGEDFGYLLAKVPGVMFWLGVDSEYGLHHNQFNPKEAALQVGVETMEAYFRKIDRED